MKNANDMGFNSKDISSLNDLLNARELTGQMPETMPTGLCGENNLSMSGDDNCNCNCNCGGGGGSGRCYV